MSLPSVQGSGSDFLEEGMCPGAGWTYLPTSSAVALYTVQSTYVEGRRISDLLVYSVGQVRVTIVLLIIQMLTY